MKGPDANRRATSSAHVWGETTDPAGRRATARITTANPYRLTIDGALTAVIDLLAATAPRLGAHTPATPVRRRPHHPAPGQRPLTISPDRRIPDVTTVPRSALISGASAGIGATFARHLAARGYQLLLVARRADRLHDLAAQLTEQHKVRCEVFAADLTDPASPAAILRYADEQGLNIDVLINNAGLSGKTAFADTPWDSLAGEIQLMVTAQTELAHRVIPGMKERRWGRIVNLSSLAAFAPPAASLLYTGIKSYVLNTSQALDMELKPHGIHVTALCPGFTHTEFHDVMGTRDKANRLPGILWQQPEAVVAEGWKAVQNGKPVCVPGLVNKISVAAMKPLPIRLAYLAGKTLNPFKNS